MSNFNYCPIVWHRCGETNTRKIEKIQERALRFILRNPNLNQIRQLRYKSQHVFNRKLYKCVMKYLRYSNLSIPLYSIL